MRSIDLSLSSWICVAYSVVGGQCGHWTGRVRQRHSEGSAYVGSTFNIIQCSVRDARQDVVYCALLLALLEHAPDLVGAQDARG